MAPAHTHSPPAEAQRCRGPHRRARSAGTPGRDRAAYTRKGGRGSTTAGGGAAFGRQPREGVHTSLAAEGRRRSPCGPRTSTPHAGTFTRRPTASPRSGGLRERSGGQVPMRRGDWRGWGGGVAPSGSHAPTANAQRHCGPLRQARTPGQPALLRPTPGRRTGASRPRQGISLLPDGGRKMEGAHTSSRRSRRRPPRGQQR
jgi:hypothetical protein